MTRVETDIKKTMVSGVLTTTATQLSPVKCEGLNGHVSFYSYNLSTAAIYALFKGAHINTTTTSYWAAIGTTATIAASAGAGFIIKSDIAALSGDYNYITVEYQAAATGGVSATVMQLSVW